MKVLRVVQLSILLVVGLLVAPGPASATWPGSNGKIYFTCRPTGGTFAGVDICSVNPDGSALVNLTNTPDVGEYSPQSSADGNRIVFRRGTSADTYRAWVMNADGSNQVQVSFVPTDGGSFTPDGRVAFRAQVGGVYEFHVVSAVGGAAASPFWTANVTGSVLPPRFASSGAFVYARTVPIPAMATTYTQQIFRVDGNTETQLTFGQPGVNSNQQPSWSPDTNTILFWRSTSGDADIWKVSSSGGTPEQVTDTPNSVSEEGNPSYSPDGQKMVWDHQDSTYDFFTRQIAIGNADGSDFSLIPLPGYVQAYAPFWAPVPTGSSPPPPPPPPGSSTATAPKKIKKGKALKVKLSCTGGTRCATTYSAAVSVPIKGKRKPKVFKVKAKTVTLEPGAGKTVTVKTPRAAKRPIAKALKNRKKPTIKVTITSKDPATGLPIAKKRTLTVKVTS